MLNFGKARIWDVVKFIHKQGYKLKFHDASIGLTNFGTKTIYIPRGTGYSLYKASLIAHEASHTMDNHAKKVHSKVAYLFFNFCYELRAYKNQYDFRYGSFFMNWVWAFMAIEPFYYREWLNQAKKVEKWL